MTEGEARPAPHIDATGVPNLDAVLGGGLVRATLTLVAGSLGTGKTTLALAFTLAGVALGEPALFLGFRGRRRSWRARRGSSVTGRP